MSCKDCIHYVVCNNYDIAEHLPWGLVECGWYIDKTRCVTIDDDFCTILICAERYALGRQTYMPRLVVDYMTPLLTKMDTRSLVAIKRDLIT